MAGDQNPIESSEEVIAAASRALVLGIGGGGDVGGSLAVGRHCERLGTGFALGGVAWERWAIDPYPGPRRLDELDGLTRLSAAAALVGPAATTPLGTRVAESGMAEHLGEPVALIDVTGGVAAISDGIAVAATELGCDLVILADIGGDALASGSEPGLASPLCDALVLAAGNQLPAELGRLGCILGAGCDGELTPDEVLARIAAVAAEGGWLGATAMPPAVAAEIERAADRVPTEASLLAARCARGLTGATPIRGGRRTVQCTPAAAVGFFYDVAVAVSGPAPLAAAVAGTESLEAGREALAALGLRTELDYERERAREG